MNTEKWYQHRLRVRYQETDQMGVVYHANYLTWMEVGRTELIRSVGYPYQRIEEKGLLLPLVEAEVKFKQPARYDDLVSIYTRVAGYSSVRMEFAYEIRRLQGDGPVRQTSSTGTAGNGDSDSDGVVRPEGDLLVSGATRHVWVNPSWKPVRIEKEEPELWQLLVGEL